MNRQLLDPAPIWAIVIGFALALLAAYEVGFRFGRWWQRRTPDKSEEGPTGMLVGSLLALMAFLLAVTMGMAADRFDTRRRLVVEEANAIGTAYLRAGYLPEPYGEQSRVLLREYTPLRVATTDTERLAANIGRSEQIHEELWAIVEELVRTTENSDVLALYIDTVNQVFDLHTTRVVAGIHARVPETLLLLLLLGSILALGTVGYSAGLTGTRSLVSVVVLIAALSLVTILIVDLDRPRDGFLQVSQQPLIDLQQRVGPTPPT